MQQLHKERKGTFRTISGQYHISSSGCVSRLASMMCGWLHNFSVDDQGWSGKLSKNFFWKNSLADFLKAERFVPTQLQWAYLLSLSPVHLDPDGKALPSLCLESTAALKGRAHRQRLHRKATTIQRHFVQSLADSFFTLRLKHLGKTNWWRIRTVLEARFAAGVTLNISSTLRLDFLVISKDGVKSAEPPWHRNKVGSGVEIARIMIVDCLLPCHKCSNPSSFWKSGVQRC